MSLQQQHLCDRIRQKDPKALEELYIETEKVLFSFIFRMVKNKHDSEVILEDIFKRLWKEAPTILNQTTRQWLFTQARLHTLKKMRQQVSQPLAKQRLLS